MVLDKRVMITLKLALKNYFSLNKVSWEPLKMFSISKSMMGKACVHDKSALQGSWASVWGAELLSGFVLIMTVSLADLLWGAMSAYLTA